MHLSETSAAHLTSQADLPPRWGLGLMLGAQDAEVDQLLSALIAHAVPASSVQLTPSQDDAALALVQAARLRLIAPLNMAVSDNPAIELPFRGGGADCPQTSEGLRMLRVTPELGPLPDSREGIRTALTKALDLAREGQDFTGFAPDALPCDDPELALIRAEIALFLPRPVLPGVPAPWMDPRVTARLRRAITRRYQLLPALYSSFLNARRLGVPFLTGQPEALLLGQDLLILSPIGPEPFALPDADLGWFDIDSGTWYAPGSTITRDGVCLFVRAGQCLAQVMGLHDSANPMGLRNQFGTPTLTLFPPPGPFEARQTLLISDDGETVDANQSQIMIMLKGDETRLDLDCDVLGEIPPMMPQMRLRLPTGEERSLWFKGMPAISGGLADFDPAPPLPMGPVDD